MTTIYTEDEYNILLSINKALRDRHDWEEDMLTREVIRDMLKSNIKKILRYEVAAFGGVHEEDHS